MQAGCLCRDCGERYKVDLCLSDDLWQEIWHDNKGLICGACIMKRIEKLDIYRTFSLNEIK